MKLKILLFLLCCSCAAMAQQLKAGAFEYAPQDIDAAFYKVLDANNKPCALLKVLLIEPEARLEGDVVKITHEENEYWAYMAEGATYIKIRTENYLPYEYRFPEPLVGGQTYILTIIKEDKIHLTQNCFYFGGSYSVGSFSGVTSMLGCTLHNIDLQLSYTVGLNKKGPVNFYNSDDLSFLCKSEYSLNSFAAKIGYQFTLASHFGIVPQVGFSYQSLVCHTLDGIEGKGGGAAADCAIIGGKFIYSPWKHVCLFMNPEYDFSVKKDRMFDTIATSADFNASGFYCNFGILANF